MLKKVLVLLVSLFIMGYAAEDEECLHGKIVAADTREPLEGVELYTDYLPDTIKTNANGEFKFDRCVSVKNFLKKNIKGEPFLRGNIISFDIREPETFVRLNIYNLGGKLLKSIINKKLPANSYSFKIPLQELSTSVSVCIINLQIGKKSFSQQIVLNKEGIFNSGKIKNLKNRDLNIEGQKNAEETERIDYLYVYKNHFEMLMIPIYSYKGRIDTALVAEDTLPPEIEKFSWPDTAWYEIRDSLAANNGWKKFWDVDSMKANIKYKDNKEAYIRPPTSTVDHSVPGFEIIPYKIEDYASNFVEKSIFLILYDSTIIDTVPPNITVVPDTLILNKGDKISLDTGVTVKDDIDSAINDYKNYLNITDDIKSTKERFGHLNRDVILDVPGTYTVTYRIIDTHKNLAEKKRVIIVKE